MARCWGVRGIFEEASLMKDRGGVFCVCMCRIIGDGEKRERSGWGERLEVGYDGGQMIPTIANARHVYRVCFFFTSGMRWLC
jgi:hypothetical protein